MLLVAAGSGGIALANTDGGAQLPRILSSAYVGASVGYLNTPFKNSNLLPGYTAARVNTPHAALRAIVGDQVYKHLALQITLMRPLYWVKYENINGSSGHHSVWLSVFGFTAKPSFNITPKLSLFGEGGLALTSRHGFKINNAPVMGDLNQANVLLGGGIEYRFKPHWGANIGTMYVPGSKNTQQAHVSYTYLGINYYLHPLSKATVDNSAKNNDLFPQNYIYGSLANSALGYGPLSVVSAKKFPVFFRGAVRTKQGYGLGYERMVFHTEKRFSLNVGGSAYYWQTKINKTNFITVSIYPELRFWLLNRSNFAWYFNYEIAGPTYISSSKLDNQSIGKNFIFQDYIGTGFSFGPERRMNLGIKMIHYSNGNMFPQNPGVETPLTIDFGYSF